MELEDAVRNAFESGGLLARSTDGFTVRTGQQQLALAVAQTLKSGGVLVAEAATGVGKTYAYLVPTLLSGKGVLFSTATKTLQDQLFNRDLPRLISTLGIPVNVALLKGRANYVCPHRLELIRKSLEPSKKQTHNLLTEIAHWAVRSDTGDLAEFPKLSERSDLHKFVTSSRDNCLGSDCPKVHECPLVRARHTAQKADIVVVNHALFFANMALSEAGVAELLPTVQTIVFDEAHQLNEIGVQFLGRNFSTAQLFDLAQDVLLNCLQIKNHAIRDIADWGELAGNLDLAGRDFRLAVLSSHNSRLAWNDEFPEGVDQQIWKKGVTDVIVALDDLAVGLDTAKATCETIKKTLEVAKKALESIKEPSNNSAKSQAEVRDRAKKIDTVNKDLDIIKTTVPDLIKLLARTETLTSELEDFQKPTARDHVRWVEITASALRLVESPLDIADKMHMCITGQAEPVYESAESGTEIEVEPAINNVNPFDPFADPELVSSDLKKRSWIFVSATLGDDANLTWFTEPCGLKNPKILRIGSPFNYAKQAAVYVPSNIVLPTDPMHSEQVALLAGDAAELIGGRTLVLTTSLRALDIIGKLLTARFRDLEVMVQNQLSKRIILERFVQGGQYGRGCIVVAAGSFWEGVDVPGDALQLVIIDKLPFPLPTDPLFVARSRKMTEQGKKPFFDLALPEAAVALKQGAGRLIRRETDYGIVVICDIRLNTKSYGRRLLAAIPPMRRLVNQQEFETALRALSQKTATSPSSGQRKGG